MNERLENISAVSSALRLADVDFEALYSGRNDITPLAAVEIYLSEQLKIKTEKQNAVRRKRANLPNEKTHLLSSAKRLCSKTENVLDSLISVFRKAFPKS